MQKHEDNLASRINGNALQPLSGVTVTVVNDATGLPAVLYSDNGVTLITAPIITDANGYYSFYAADGKYTVTHSGVRLSSPVLRKIILEDPDDNPAATLGQLAASGGGALVKTAALGTGAVVQSVEEILRERVSVKGYGAKVDGSADDALAFSKAIAARAKFSLGGGTSKSTATITTGVGTVITGVPQAKNGPLVTGADTVLTSTLVGMEIGGAQNAWRGINIRPITTKVVSSIGVKGVDKYHFTLEDGLIENFETGISQEKSLYHTYRRVGVFGCTTGAKFIGTAGAWNSAWFNNVVTMENCIFLANSLCHLDFQGQGLKAINCDFSGGASQAAVRIRAGTKDADFNACYVEALTAGSTCYLVEGGTTRITGGFMQGGSSGARLESMVTATGGAHVIVNGITGQDFFNYLYKADGPGSVIYIMPGTSHSASATTFKLETNGGKVIDLSAFNADTKLDASLFLTDAVAIGVGGTYTYQLIESETVSIRAYLVLNGGYNIYSVTGTAIWINFGGGTGNASNTFAVSAGVTAVINSGTGLLTITNNSGFAGVIRFKATTR